MAAGACYVYEHIRPDTGDVFYVGKGSGARARVEQHRNRWWKAIVEKAGGYEVRIIADDLDEELALFAEMELIDKHRTLGSSLCNMTDGGEGMSGYRFSPETIERRASKLRGRSRPDISDRMKGVPKSESHRAALSKAKLGTKASAEARRKMSAARTGRPSMMLGKHHRLESRQKISQATTGANNPFFGRAHTIESRTKMSTARTGRKDPPETRAKKSAARQGQKNPRWGVRIPDEQKARQIATLKSRPRVTCPHCERTMDEANARRWHFENCKERR